ncbi:MAG: hypothetical protein HC764_10050 [Pleurocapsa sp. CRU_1_2]|nr:hypothetical protein [Pleurocapsa sp. CRU_1_2]
MLTFSALPSSPKFHSTVWMSSVPASVKLPLKAIALTIQKQLHLRYIIGGAAKIFGLAGN